MPHAAERAKWNGGWRAVPVAELWIQRNELATVWAMYGKVRVQLLVQKDTESEHCVANHFSRWQAIKLAFAIFRRALGRLT